MATVKVDMTATHSHQYEGEQKKHKDPAAESERLMGHALYLQSNTYNYNLF